MRKLVHAVFSRVFRVLFGTRLAQAVWRLPGSRAFYQWLMPRLRPGEVEVDGHRIRLDRMDSLLLSINGNYEAEGQALFVSAIEPGDVVVDVGAHIGLYTLQAARAVGPSGTVWAFEPSSENHSLLETNVAANGYSNVNIRKEAVSDETGEAALALSTVNTGDHSLVTETTAGRRTETVPVVRLDDVVEGPVAVIKMDIQGSEVAALRGARRLIDASPELAVFTEYSPDHLAAHGGGEVLIEELRSLGFSVHQVLADGRLQPWSDSVDQRLSGEHCDLVALKGRSTVRRR